MTTKEFKKHDKNIYPPFHPEPITAPGTEEKMRLQPRSIHENYQASKKLDGKTALITGGDSGIGRAVCLHFALEGAKLAFTYLPSEKEDALAVKKMISEQGQEVLAIPADLSKEGSEIEVIQEVVKKFGVLNIVVNNAAFQKHLDDIDELSFEQFKYTFDVNLFAYFKMVKAALPHLKEGSCIINTSSILGSVGDAQLIDYASTKGAINALTKSLSKALAKRQIRVNAVAPGPVWTPLNPAERDESEIKEFGASTSFNRPAQPAELAPAYVFLASDISGSYITGETINLFGSASGAN